MPSAEHESPLALAKLDPSLVTWLLVNLFEAKVPRYHHARAHPTEAQVLVPRTYHADGVLLFCDPDDRPLLAVVLEVQRKWDITKRRVWKLYVAHFETELDVDTALVAYCPDVPTGHRYRNLFALDEPYLSLHPLIFTPADVPLVVDPDMARLNPALTVLSALCHGHRSDVDDIFPALVAALRAVEAKKAILYYDVVLAGLPTAARARWEAYMTTTAGHEYRSELFRDLAAQHQAEGEARGQAIGQAIGEARAVLTVLESRNVPVPTDIRDQILACTDLTRLDTWLRRAVTAPTAADVVHE